MSISRPRFNHPGRVPILRITFWWAGLLRLSGAPPLVATDAAIGEAEALHEAVSVVGRVVAYGDGFPL